MKPSDWDALVDEYHKHIISPFQPGVKNPLFRKLGAIKNKEKKTVADIGCGRGCILDRLAKQFKKVYAIDFSSKMIKTAKQRNVSKNIAYVKKDMRNLSAYYKKFDVVIAINSVLLPKIKDVKRSLLSIQGTLKKGGKFFGIFPSMNAVLYQGFLILEDQLKKHKEEKIALEETKRILERKKYGFIKGIYDDDGEMQKFYYDFALEIRLRDAGFKNIKISKVKYPWGTATGDYEDFPGMPEMWDWFVEAER